MDAGGGPPPGPLGQGPARPLATPAKGACAQALRGARWRRAPARNGPLWKPPGRRDPLLLLGDEVERRGGLGFGCGRVTHGFSDCYTITHHFNTHCSSPGLRGNSLINHQSTGPRRPPGGFQRGAIAGWRAALPCAARSQPARPPLAGVARGRGGPLPRGSGGGDRPRLKRKESVYDRENNARAQRQSCNTPTLNMLQLKH